MIAKDSAEYQRRKGALQRAEMRTFFAVICFIFGLFCLARPVGLENTVGNALGEALAFFILSVIILVDKRGVISKLQTKLVGKQCFG